MVARPQPIQDLRGARHALAIASFVALALFQIHPVIGDFRTSAIGHEGNDVWNHIWGFAYVANSLAEGRLPIHTDLLLWPNGGSLWFIDTLNAVLTLPVQWALGPVAAMNTAILFNFALAGIGAYVLAWRVTQTQAGAWLAGVAFQAAPHLMGQAYNGITESLSVGWLPLALLAIREAAMRPDRNRSIVAGAAVGITAVANWYYGLFAGIALLGFLARGAWRLHRAGQGPSREQVLALAWGTAIGALIVAPPFWVFRSTMAAADAVVARDPGFVWSTLVMHNMTDLVGLVRPGRHYSPDLAALFDEDLIVVTYVGHALLWPALLTLATRYRPRVWSWVGYAAVMGVLSLGPFLYVGGDYVQVLDGWLPLPFLGLYEWAPMFSRISHAYRFVVGLTLALCIMLAWTIRVARFRGWPVWPLAIGLAACRITESFLGSPAVFPLPTATVEVSAAVAALDEGAVLDLPIGIPVLARSRYSMQQLVNNRPSPYGLNDPVPRSLVANHFTRYLVELEWSNVHTLPANMPWLDLEVGRQAAIADGLQWIVMHKAGFPKPLFARQARFLDLVATPVHDGGHTRIYRLDP
jgi:hypothetical protein